jgi:K+-transporting ATPase KdpF subunit
VRPGLRVLPMFDLLLGAAVAIGLGIYLIYALIWPESL